ncbi:MAG: NADH-quinone oxidoreductase subunit A [Candidatus Obscuribacterales bacterium]|nr:NADH-quinone oxidoreductase subunit A [Candidatus Obscuribacterales bacterium]
MYELQTTQIILFVVVGIALPAIGMILLAWFLQCVLGYHTPNPMKTQPYECGMKPMQEALVQFDIRYYLYALLFILFDIEIIFIIPWALATDKLPEIFGEAAWWLGPVEITIFLVILAFGLAYAWKKGALQWE